MSYVDQSRDALRDDLTVFQEITDNVEAIKVGNREVPARAYVSSFNFRGSDHQKLVGTLSGGERNRVHLAKLLQTGGNVLLLDEPTNDLDVDTLRALEAGLESFPGCVVVISHDRWFLDRIATHILAFEGDSQVRFFQGNVSDYEDVPAQGARHGRRAAAPDQVQAARGLTARCRLRITTSRTSTTRAWPTRRRSWRWSSSVFSGDDPVRARAIQAAYAEAGARAVSRARWTSPCRSPSFRTSSRRAAGAGSSRRPTMRAPSNAAWVREFLDRPLTPRRG